MGELNSPHEAYGASYAPKRGTTLANYLTDIYLVMLSTDEPTLYHRATGNPNILDLAICMPNMNKYLNFAGSDLLPIIITMDHKTTRI